MLTITEEENRKLKALVSTRLTAEELSAIVDMWDSGELDVIFKEVFLPLAIVNFPQKYIKLEEEEE